MSHVEVESTSIQKKTAVSRRFFVIPIMQVYRANVTFPKQIVLYLNRPGVRLALGLVLGDQTAILGLETNDSVHRFAASDQNPTPATEKSSANSKKNRAILCVRPSSFGCCLVPFGEPGAGEISGAAPELRAAEGRASLRRAAEPGAAGKRASQRREVGRDGVGRCEPQRREAGSETEVLPDGWRLPAENRPAPFLSLPFCVSVLVRDLRVWPLPGHAFPNSAAPVGPRLFEAHRSLVFPLAPSLAFSPLSPPGASWEVHPV